MPRIKKPSPELRKEFDICEEALSFIEKLEKKGNKTGRLGCTPKTSEVWKWYVRYKEK